MFLLLGLFIAKLLNTSSNIPKRTYKYGSNYLSVAKIVYWEREIKEQNKTENFTMKRHADRSNSTTRQLYNEETTRQIKEKNKTKNCIMKTQADVSKSRTIQKLILIKVVK